MIFFYLININLLDDINLKYLNVLSRRYKYSWTSLYSLFPNNSIICKCLLLDFTFFFKY